MSRCTPSSLVQLLFDASLPTRGAPPSPRREERLFPPLEQPLLPGRPDDEEPHLHEEDERAGSGPVDVALERSPRPGEQSRPPPCAPARRSVSPRRSRSRRRPRGPPACSAQSTAPPAAPSPLLPGASSRSPALSQATEGRRRPSGSTPSPPVAGAEPAVALTAPRGGCSSRPPRTAAKYRPDGRRSCSAAIA